ncbi:hypothetical protein [uncultured Lacinutrix sp.]|uniref:hypothetical protein n=1 Tax=uncultured Lacinutrix sp. TaxID=574032 RepID=UPI00262A844B|nr:hypothetical protein [uncultured Lacinutrix sp.]
MDTHRNNLLKHFAMVMRNLALGKQTDTMMSKNLVFYFTRKELIDMLKKRFNGTIPKQHNLLELENRELLNLIDNDLFIISYVTEKWSKEIVKEAPKKELPQKITPKNDTKDGAKK